MAQSLKKELGHAQTNTAASLRVVDVRKSFASPNGSRLEVLRGVTFDLRAGEAVAITGASGSGKSTLLHLLGGLDTPDHGSVVVSSKDIASMSADATAKFRQSRIGFVFQFHYLLNDLSAIENVTLPLMISRTSVTQAQTRARALLTEVGLTERFDHPVSHLSGGEQQRVALARALVTSPQLLLADEPTGNLDSATGDEIGKIIVNYARSTQGNAIIATHNEALAKICDRVLLLDDGRIHVV